MAAPLRRWQLRLRNAVNAAIGARSVSIGHSIVDVQFAQLQQCCEQVEVADSGQGESD